MNKYKISVFFILLLFYTTLSSNIVISQSEPPIWNKNWSYNQIIVLPIDTSLPASEFQPIDIRIRFDSPCWGKNDIEHSLRIVCWDGSKWHELESQIYDLEKTEMDLIESCSVVFLIPNFADGNEKYYVYYNDEERSSPGYQDRVSISEEHYFYEPFPGENVNIDYYKINDEQKCVYGVGIKGNMMTEYGSNLIFRQKANKEEFNVQNWDQLVGFCFQYDNKKGDVITTRAKLVSSEIFTDGNLMIHFGIVSENNDGSAKTTNYYKYYYSPTDSKRINVDTKSEISNNIKIDDNIERDGTFVFLSSFKTRSESNIAMNMGEILPYFHVSSENGEILEYHVETNPKAREEHKIVAISNDIDLGENAWFSTDNGKNGKAHGIVFSTNKNIIKKGTNENDGIQIKAYEKEEASLPGLKAYSAGIYCGRNSYEKQGSWDSQIPSDLTIEFRGELFTTETQGYELVEDEVKMFKQLIELRPFFGGEIKDHKEKETRKLNIYVPFGKSRTLITALLPIPLQITWVEVYQNQILISSGATSKSLLGWHIEFPKIPVGNCVIKVYKRHGDKSEFVGFRTINVIQDTITTVFCKREVVFSTVVTDQNNNELEKVKVIILNNNETIGETKTNTQGKAVIKIPAYNSYQLQILYKNIIVKKEELSLLISKNIERSIQLSSLTVKVKDTLGLNPGVDLIPMLISKEMTDTIKLSPDDIKNNEYKYTNLPPSIYSIQLSYEGLIDDIEHKIPNDGDTVEIIFSSKFTFSVKIFDNRGGILESGKINLHRENKDIQSNINKNGESELTVPPGKYMLTIYKNDDLIRETKVKILRDSELYIVTENEPSYPLIFMVLSGLIIAIGFVLFFIKKVKLATFLKLICISILILAIIQPWWELQGKSDKNNVERFSKAYIIPQTIVTTTKTEDYVEAEPANLPSDFSDFVFAVFIFTCFSILFIILSMFIKNRKRLSFGICVFSIILLILTIAIFSYGFSELAKTGLGVLQGSKTLSILKPGTNDYIEISANWGLSGGLYFCILVVIILIFTLFIEKKIQVFKDKV